MFADIYWNILFSKSSHWNCAVFQGSDEHLTSADEPNATDRSISFELVGGVAIYGRCAGTETGRHSMATLALKRLPDAMADGRAKESRDCRAITEENRHVMNIGDYRVGSQIYLPSLSIYPSLLSTATFAKPSVNGLARSNFGLITKSLFLSM